TGWVNKGSLVANGSGGTLTLDGTNWVNQGTISLTDGALGLSGSTTTANLGLAGLTPSGATEVGLDAALDNTNATLAINSARGDLLSPGGRITGGTIPTDGTAHLVMVYGQINRLVNVSVGLGAARFAENGYVRLSGTSTLASGEVLDLTAGNNVLAFEQTK